MKHEKSIVALRMQRQFLSRKASREEYDLLYRDTQPGQNVYWNGFGDPPSITYRADFDDVSYNRERQQNRTLLKGRFQGGNLGWILRDDLELFAGLSRRPLGLPTEKQQMIYELISHEGPMNIQVMKEMTGMLVKEITPVLHRLQEAFLVYEDQPDGQWDRGWCLFAEMFPDADITRCSREDALSVVLRRFACRHVAFDSKMAKSFYKLPEKEIKAAIAALAEGGTLVESDGMYLLKDDFNWLEENGIEPPRSVFAMHRNDFLVKSNEHILKNKFKHQQHETLQYILIDGEFRGAVVGKFKYTPNILEDVILDLPPSEKESRKDEIIEAIYRINGEENALIRYDGNLLIK